MNPATYQKDITEVRTGGWLLYDSTWPLDPRLSRPDVTYLGIPLAEMCNAQFSGVRERILMKNIAYAGALCALLNMDTSIIRTLLKEKFSKKPALMDSNQQAIDIGYDYAKANFACPLPIHLEPMDKTKDSILIDGNTAAGARVPVCGGDRWRVVSDHAGHLADGSVQRLLPEVPSGARNQSQPFCDPPGGRRARRGRHGDRRVVGWRPRVHADCGARHFADEEFIGLAYYAEVPAVIFDVQRTGPSTGMPTRTQQGDLMLCAYASHGDTRHICLYPSDPREAFEFAVASFDLAERYQTPVFVLSDLDIGMNDWMVPKLTWSDSYRPDRGKVLSAEELEHVKTFHRYVDVDGDGVAYRTLPGVHPKGAYFTRGSGHNRFGGYTEDSDEYVDVLDRIDRKIQHAARAVPAPFMRPAPAAPERLGLVTVGGCHAACMEALDLLSAEGFAIDYMRVRGFPFGDDVRAFLESHAVNFIVEQNRDAQLRSLLMLETGVPVDRLESVRYYGGFPMSAHHVIAGVKKKLEKAA